MNGMIRQAGGRPLFTQAVGLNIISPVLHLNRWMGTLVRETESRLLFETLFKRRIMAGRSEVNRVIPR